MLRCLLTDGVPPSDIRCLASARSAGSRIEIDGAAWIVQDLQGARFVREEIVLLSAGGAVAKEAVPDIVKAGAVAIDNSAAFRYMDDVPLVVPEVNPEAIDAGIKRGIIANPNCSTIQLMVALFPIEQAVGIKKINISTYQAISGAGGQAISDFSARLKNKGTEALACVPEIDIFLENGYTKEEMKLVWESQKILNRPDLQVNATAVRVPVINGHSESVHITCSTPLNPLDCRQLLDAAPGVFFHHGNSYGTTDALQEDDVMVHVGRLRQDLSDPCGLNIWIVADNLLKGAASNSVQIASLVSKCLS
jgi:aspartate-semialdehyde dehydrogenase